MSYDILDKISSNVYTLSNNIILKHTVKLAGKDKKGNRKYCHEEFTYPIQTYVNRRIAKSIYLKFRSYLTIEEVGKDWTDKEVVYLDDLNLVILKSALKQCKKWFKKEDLYYYENNKLHISAQYKEELKKDIIFSSGNSIVIKPIVIEADDTEYEGIILFINKSDSYALLTYDQLRVFYKIIKKFNLYSAGLQMLSYVRRPDFGIFNTNMGTDAYDKQVSFTQSSLREKSSTEKTLTNDFFK